MPQTMRARAGSPLMHPPVKILAPAARRARAAAARAAPGYLQYRQPAAYHAPTPTLANRAGSAGTHTAARPKIVRRRPARSG